MAENIRAIKNSKWSACGCAYSTSDSVSYLIADPKYYSTEKDICIGVMAVYVTTIDLYLIDKFPSGPIGKNAELQNTGLLRTVSLADCNINNFCELCLLSYDDIKTIINISPQEVALSPIVQYQMSSGPRLTYYGLGARYNHIYFIGIK